MPSTARPKASGAGNALADAAQGFVWRLQTEEGDATAIRPYDDDRLIVNMSVWTSVETLAAYGVHVPRAVPGPGAAGSAGSGPRHACASAYPLLLASALAAVSGILIGPVTTLYYDSGFLIGLKAFVGDDQELAEVRWVDLEQADELMTGTIFEPVRNHLKKTLNDEGDR